MAIGARFCVVLTRDTRRLDDAFDECYDCGGCATISNVDSLQSISAALIIYWDRQQRNKNNQPFELLMILATAERILWVALNHALSARCTNWISEPKNGQSEKKNFFGCCRFVINWLCDLFDRCWIDDRMNITAARIVTTWARVLRLWIIGFHTLSNRVHLSLSLLLVGGRGVAALLHCRTTNDHHGHPPV